MAAGPPITRNQEATNYVGGLDARVSEDILWELFLQVGPLVSVHIPRDKPSKCHNGFGFVEFASEEDSTYAIKILNMIKLFGKPISIKRASMNQSNLDVGANLFIGNLDSDVDEKMIFDTFSAFGLVLKIPKIMRDLETGNSKGCAFINFASFEASDKALQAMNKQFLYNRPISVSYAFKKDAKEQRYGTAAERFLAATQPLVVNTCPHQYFSEGPPPLSIPEVRSISQQTLVEKHCPQEFYDEDSSYIIAPPSPRVKLDYRKKSVKVGSLKPEHNSIKKISFVSRGSQKSNMVTNPDKRSSELPKFSPIPIHPPLPLDDEPIFVPPLPPDSPPFIIESSYAAPLNNTNFQDVDDLPTMQPINMALLHNTQSCAMETISYDQSTAADPLHNTQFHFMTPLHNNQAVDLLATQPNAVSKPMYNAQSYEISPQHNIQSQTMDYLPTTQPTTMASMNNAYFLTQNSFPNIGHTTSRFGYPYHNSQPQVLDSQKTTQKNSIFPFQNNRSRFVDSLPNNESPAVVPLQKVQSQVTPPVLYITRTRGVDLHPTTQHSTMVSLRNNSQTPTNDPPLQTSAMHPFSKENILVAPQQNSQYPFLTPSHSVQFQPTVSNPNHFIAYLNSSPTGSMTYLHRTQSLTEEISPSPPPLRQLPRPAPPPLLSIDELRKYTKSSMSSFERESIPPPALARIPSLDKINPTRPPKLKKKSSCTSKADKSKPSCDLDVQILPDTSDSLYVAPSDIPLPPLKKTKANLPRALPSSIADIPLPIESPKAETTSQVFLVPAVPPPKRKRLKPTLGDLSSGNPPEKLSQALSKKLNPPFIAPPTPGPLPPRKSLPSLK